MRELLEDAYAFSTSFVKQHPDGDSVDQIMKDVSEMHKVDKVDEKDDIKTLKQYAIDFKLVD